MSKPDTTKPDSRILRDRPGRLAPQDAGHVTRRITTLAVCIGIFLAIGKWVVWESSHSVGILSSLVHSALDLFGALSTYFAVRYAARTPNDDFRFGFGKAESFSAVFQICLIVFSAFHLFEEAIERINHPEPVAQSSFAIATMIVFIAVTLWLLIAQSWAIRATGSVAVKGDRAHYFADMLGNIFVIIGIAATSYTPFLRADAIVGGLMALWLLWTAFRIAQLAWAQLMDRELPEDQRHYIRSLAAQDPRVHGVRDLRSRASGPHIHVQMRLDLDDSLSLSEAHDIIIAAEKRIMDEYKAADILIHPHPVGCDHTHGNARFRDDTLLE